MTVNELGIVAFIGKCVLYYGIIKSGLDKRLEMNDMLVEVLAKEKEHYEMGLVNKSHVMMWVESYAETSTEFEEAKQQVEAW